MRISPIILGAVLLGLAMATLLGGCTGTKTTHTRIAAGAQQIVVGRVQIAYDTRAIATDRVRRAKQIRLAEAIEEKVWQYVQSAELASERGTDTLWIQLNGFRLPRSGRWASGGFKGKDELAALTVVVRGRAPLFSTQVSAQLGANDKTIAANYSANRAMSELVNMLAWEIAWQLTRVNDRKAEAALLEAGERAGVKRAILILAHRGQLSYGDFARHSLAGRVGVENTALGAKYDACALRKIATLGLSPCQWDPDYR